MSPAAVDTLAPVITVNGSELGADQLDRLVGMRISTGLRLPARVTLDLVDDGFQFSAGGTFGIGSTITIAALRNVKLFTGKVTGVALNVEMGAPTLTVTADDAAHGMTLGNKVRTFTSVAYADIVQKISREYGLQCKITAATGDPLEYLLQTDTDFGFLTEIADRAGCDWWIDADGKLQFHPMSRDGEPTDTLGWDDLDGRLRHFSVRASALHPQTVTTTAWDPAKQQAIEVNSAKPSAKSQPDAAFAQPFLRPRELSTKSKTPSAHHQFGKRAEGQALADSAATRLLAGAVVATGLCPVNPKITIGGRVAITGVGPASGTYFVTEVEHTYDPRGFLTRFTAGERTPTGLVDTLAAPAPSSFRVDMLVVGVVTNIDGADQGRNGCVKVKYPTLGTQVESAWARVASIGAGVSRGMTFIPEINDEVIVGFEGGDITRPVVIGSVYSGRNTALDYGTKNGKVAKRQIVSRNGHLVEFLDGQGPSEQQIRTALADNAGSVVLNKADGLAATVPSGKAVKIAAGDTKIEIDTTGNIMLSGKKITLKATAGVEISGLEVKVKAQTALEGSATTVKMAGSGAAELSGGGVAAIKGGVVKIN